MVFCVFSIFYNGMLHAGTSTNLNQANSQVSYVEEQQERIINSLKKIEDCLPKTREDKNE